MKKRYWALGLLGLEIACWPAAAQILDRVSFEAPARVVHVEFPKADGLSRIFVTSNAPFAITSEGQVSPFVVNVIPTGVIGGQAFGSNAQLPGEAQSCKTAVSADRTVIYEAHQKTARDKGDPVSQAVLVEIRYPQGLDPKFDVVTKAKAEGLSISPACNGHIS